MNGFSVGNSVRTTVEWSEKYSEGTLHGRISRISPIPHPGHPDRVIFVRLTEQRGETSSAWFAPYDLELDD